MVQTNTKASESVAVLGTIAPAVYAIASPPATIWVKADQFLQYAQVIALGAFTATNLNAKLQQANTSSGGAAKDIPGKAIAQLDNSAANKQVLINVRPDELDADSGFQWFGLVLTMTGGTNVAISGSIIGLNPKVGGASVVAGSVAQIIY